MLNQLDHRNLRRIMLWEQFPISDSCAFVLAVYFLFGLLYAIMSRSYYRLTNCQWLIRRQISDSLIHQTHLSLSVILGLINIYMIFKLDLINYIINVCQLYLPLTHWLAY